METDIKCAELGWKCIVLAVQSNVAWGPAVLHAGGFFTTILTPGSDLYIRERFQYSVYAVLMSRTSQKSEIDTISSLFFCRVVYVHACIEYARVRTRLHTYNYTTQQKLIYIGLYRIRVSIRLMRLSL